MSSRDELRERLAWWKNDVAYKAPEQINHAYVARLLEDLTVRVAAPLSFVLDLETVTGAFHAIDWPSADLVAGKTPPVVYQGRCLQIIEVSVQRICEPPQVWVTYVDTDGRRFELAYEDDWRLAGPGTVNVRARNTMPWEKPV